MRICLALCLSTVVCTLAAQAPPHDDRAQHEPAAVPVAPTDAGSSAVATNAAVAPVPTAGKSDRTPSVAMPAASGAVPAAGGPARAAVFTPTAMPVSPATVPAAPAAKSASAAAPAAVPAPPKPAASIPKSPPPPAAPPALATIRGQLSLTSGGRPLRPDDAVDAVVYFRPATPVPVVLPAQPLVIATERKTFVPRVLPVPVGASVRFPNNDPILHNVFSTAKEASFDLGLYGRSEGESQRFTQPGVIRVYCNVHHAMVAHVLVLDTPFFTKPDAQGRFRLTGVPAEAGELYVWHERSQLWRAAVTPGVTPDVQVKLELSRRRVPPHLNKTGQPYRRTRPDEY
ncbi:MAG: hypothetical protein IT479_08295 [Xanthomonadales bacterium]|nr:hypothetical protein [Xanthomonadales bacterium]